MPDVLQPRWLSNAIVLLMLVTVVCFVSPFVHAFAWGVWAAILTWPLYERLELRLRRPWLSTLLMVLGLLAVLLLFLGLLLDLSTGELHKLVSFALRANATGLPPPPWLQTLPMGADVSAWWQEHLAKPQGLSWFFGSEWQAMSGTATSMVSHVSQWLVHNVLLLSFSIIVLVCTYIHGASIGAATLQLAPRIHAHAAEFLLAIPRAVRATALGMGMIALLEGTVLGIAYTIAGVPSPVVFGLVTAFMALVPGGAPLSFTLASIFLYATGHSVAALGLFSWGVFELFMVDKFIRPKVIGHTIHLPFLPVFVGLIGGLEMFGLVGLVYGPAVMLLAVMLWRRTTASLGEEKPAQPSA